MTLLMRDREKLKEGIEIGVARGVAQERAVWEEKEATWTLERTVLENEKAALKDKNSALENEKAQLLKRLKEMEKNNKS